MPKFEVNVCVGTHCTMMGAMDIIAAVESLNDLEQIGEDCEILVNHSACNSVCELGSLSPVVTINDKVYTQTDSETIMSEVLELVRAQGCLG